MILPGGKQHGKTSAFCSHWELHFWNLIEFYGFFGILGFFWNLLVSFGIFGNLMKAIGIFLNLLESYGIFWNLMNSFGKFWFFWILLSLQAVSAGCLCRLSLQLNPLESFLEQLGWPGILAPRSYLTVHWVSWAPRVSRVSRALFKNIFVPPSK